MGQVPKSTSAFTSLAGKSAVQILGNAATSDVARARMPPGTSSMTARTGFT